ncbi:MAG: AAA family ATPase [Bacteroidales bacterium]|jgi:exodeoxyribonuclease-5
MALLAGSFMEINQLKNNILTHFGHLPTDDQAQAMNHLSSFTLSTKPSPLYMLKGYAGTGKTSLMSAYVKALATMEIPFVLMAPTGRAAKVFSHYAGFRAHTIHRYIYLFITNADGKTNIILSPNKLSKAVFIVDEASMIGDTSQEPGSVFNRSLLIDLFEYVYRNSGNKLILIGDTAQLPPVGLDISPALNLKLLQTTFNITGYQHLMREVMRQSFDSGILQSATQLRNKVEHEAILHPLFLIPNQVKDVMLIESGFEMEEELTNAFGSSASEDCVVICKSNKRANLFNQQIRNKVLGRDNELEGGDLLMVVKNNYFWLGNDAKAGFIANGDMVSIQRVVRVEERYGLRFADVEIQLVDYPEEKTMEVKMILDTLMAEGPDIPRSEMDKLFHAVEAEYSDYPKRRTRLDKVRVDPWYNALHVKFGYALTCHKTQGGQWENVFVDQGYLPEEQVDIAYLRWLYTAVTRATSKLYLMGFNPGLIEQADN